MRELAFAEAQQRKDLPTLVGGGCTPRVLAGPLGRRRRCIVAAIGGMQRERERAAGATASGIGGGSPRIASVSALDKSRTRAEKRSPVPGETLPAARNHRARTSIGAGASTAAGLASCAAMGAILILGDDAADRRQKLFHAWLVVSSAGHYATSVRKTLRHRRRERRLRRGRVHSCAYGHFG